MCGDRLDTWLGNFFLSFGCIKHMGSGWVRGGERGLGKSVIGFGYHGTIRLPEGCPGLYICVFVCVNGLDGGSI